MGEDKKVKAQDVQESLGKSKVEEAVKKADFQASIKTIKGLVKDLKKEAKKVAKLSEKVTEDDLNNKELKKFVTEFNTLAEILENDIVDDLSFAAVNLEDIVSARL